MERRIEGYKAAELSDTAAHDVMIRATDSGVVAFNKLGYVIEEWRNPTHEEFQARTGWSLFNAFTEVLKRYSQIELPRRTMALHGLMDRACDVPSLEETLPELGEDAEETVR
jgi:hypothetical protein